MIPDLNQETENEVFRDSAILGTQREHVRRKDGLVLRAVIHGPLAISTPLNLS